MALRIAHLRGIVASTISVGVATVGLNGFAGSAGCVGDDPTPPGTTSTNDGSAPCANDDVCTAATIDSGSSGADDGSVSTDTAVSTDGPPQSCLSPTATFPFEQPPRGKIAVQCSAVATNNLADACAQDLTSKACADAQLINPNCWSCMKSNKTDKVWSAIVSDPGEPVPAFYNRAVCIDLIPAFKTCGTPYMQLKQCLDATCRTCSAGSENDACRIAAMDAKCKDYALTGTCANNAAQIAASECFSDVTELFKSLASRFCG